MPIQQDLLAGAPLRTLATARAAGEVAADRCAARAERVSDFDTEAAGDFIVALLKMHGPKSGEALVNAAKQHGHCPPDDRAFGAVFSRLSRQKAIVHVGHCDRMKGHGTAGGRLWGAAQ